MVPFIKFINSLVLLDEKAEKDFSSCLKNTVIKKNDFVLKKGTVCHNIMFIDQGLVKTCFYKEDKELIMRFFSENHLLSVLDSYILEKPSKFAIQTLENTSITYINHLDMELLCKKHHCIETFYRKLLSMATVQMMHRISEMLEAPPSVRYRNFTKEHPHLLQRISLGDLANYLGISQVSLSRIRAKK